VGIPQGHETIGDETDGRGEAWRVRVLVLKDLVKHRDYEVPSDQIATGIIKSVLTAPRPLDKRR
jgi:hypothetical protein